MSNKETEDLKRSLEHYKALSEQKIAYGLFMSYLYHEQFRLADNKQKELSNLNKAYLRLLKKYKYLKKQYELDFTEPKP